MKTSLAQALIDRGIINSTTRIIAKCPIFAMGNAPAEQTLPLTVNRVIYEADEIKFISTTRTGKKYSVPSSKVEMIDGMHPVRLAAAYDIKPDGLKRAPGKKRGRKPRINTQEQLNG
jgi:hypothetical protein